MIAPFTMKPSEACRLEKKNPIPIRISQSRLVFSFIFSLKTAFIFTFSSINPSRKNEPGFWYRIPPGNKPGKEIPTRTWAQSSPGKFYLKMTVISLNLFISHNCILY